MSISPLDRLLNQATQQDDLIVRVSCAPDDTPRTIETFNKVNEAQQATLEGTIGDNYTQHNFSFNTDHVNKVVCQNGKIPGTNQAC